MGDSELEKDITLMRNYEFYTFAKEMHKKYASKVREGRSLKPWEDYSWEHLNSRLTDEILEHDEATREYYYEETDEAKEKLKKECLDVANFCMFIWLHLSMDEMYETGD